MSATFGRAGIAMTGVLLTGYPIGTLMGFYPRLYSFAAPIIELYRPLPQLAYFSLLIIWLGIGEPSKVLLLYLAALPSVLLLTSDSVAKVNNARVQGAQTLGAGKFDIFYRIVLPSVWPDLLVASRLAFMLIYATVVSAELVAAPTGLGSLAIDAENAGQIALLVADIWIMGITALMANVFFNWIYDRTCSWSRYR